MGDQPFGISTDTLSLIAHQIRNVQDMGIEVAVVVGGGNMFRGSDASTAGMDRATADYAGMLATVINALALHDALEKVGLTVRTQSAITIQAVAEPYIRLRAIRHLEKGRVVIFAAGTGNPYMTTDTAAALRAIEVDCDALLMAKHGVDGVYSADPAVDPTATRYAQLTHLDAIQRRLKVMDITALSMCMENHLPIVVFDVATPDGIYRALRGDHVGTLIASQPETEPVGNI